MGAWDPREWTIKQQNGRKKLGILPAYIVYLPDDYLNTGITASFYRTEEILLYSHADCVGEFSKKLREEVLHLVYCIVFGGTILGLEE